MLRRRDARVKRQRSDATRQTSPRRNQLASANPVPPPADALPIVATAAAPHSHLPFRPALGPRLYGGLAASLAFAALAGWFAIYPLDPLVAGALLAAYGLLVLWQPTSWLLVMPALWPVIDLAPWSGQIYFTESDALALASLAALGLREAFAPPAPTLSGRAPVKLTVTALVVFGLLAVSVLISGLRGLNPPPSLDASAMVGYNSTLNAVRVGKGFVLAFMLIPFLHLAIRRNGQAALDKLTVGLTLGLASCALAALWERLAFPGFANFGSDYRTTALFWEMHVGGAALDAWLMLCFPFALLSLRQNRTPLAKGLALVAVGLGSYASFTTFSRIVYAAIAVSLTLLGALALLRPTPASADNEPRRLGVLLALIAAVLIGGGLTFPEGGYRGLAAFTGAALLGYISGGAVAGIRLGHLATGMMTGVMLLAVGALATLLLPKGVYLIYALSWTLTASVLSVVWKRGRDTVPSPIVVALLTWTILNTVQISAYWSEPTRFVGTAIAAALVLAPIAGQALGRTPLWAPKPGDLYGVIAVLALGGMLVTTLGGYYMNSRLSATRDDVGVRFEHYANSLRLMQSSGDTVAGIGLGRYPDAYFWTIENPGVPGSLALHRDAGGRYMQLGGPRGVRSGDESLLLTQRIPVATESWVHYRFKARSAQDLGIALHLCRKHLLYDDFCTRVSIPLKGRDGWQSFEGIFPEPLAGPGIPPRLATFSVSMNSRTQVDVDAFELVDSQLRPLLRNGDFEQGNDFWFFTSDRDHLPWHAKNLFVHTYVEQGLLGLVALVLALSTAFARLLRRPTRLHPFAPNLLAALVGVTTVGLVDSLIDIPRITLFLTLLLWLALNLRQPAAR